MAERTDNTDKKITYGKIYGKIDCEEDGRLSEKDISSLIRSAIIARNRAYARYSNFKVGAALLACSGDQEAANDSEYRVFTGCNIENSSYGATMCAERAAVSGAVSGGYRNFKAIAIVGGLDSTGIKGITYPCGICRQVLAEFSKDMYVIAARSVDDYDMRKLSDYLPSAFEAESMN